MSIKGRVGSYVLPYRGTPIVRNATLLGPSSRTMPRVLGGSYEGGRFLISTPALRHGSLNPLFQVAVYLPSRIQEDKQEGDEDVDGVVLVNKKRLIMLCQVTQTVKLIILCKATLGTSLTPQDLYRGTSLTKKTPHPSTPR